jgi:hypothetical protein
MLERLAGDRTGRPRAQQLVLREMMDEMNEERTEARKALRRRVEELEREDFPRRFLASVARETI